MREDKKPPASQSKPYLQLGVAIRNGHLDSRMQVLSGVLDYALEQTCIRALFIPIRDGWLPEAQLLARLDGLITLSSAEDGWIRELSRMGLPVVDCDGSFIGKIPTVWPGHRQQIAYEFVKNLGRKTIGYIGSRSHWENNQDVTARFRSDAEQQGLDFHEFADLLQDPAIDPPRMLAGDGGVALYQFLKDLPKPAAIWCLHDELATLVWRIAEELGLHVPNDLALMGCGDHVCALHGTAGLTTLNMIGSRVGYKAAHLLHRHLTGHELLEPAMVHLVQPGATVIERLSTGGSAPGNRGVQRAWRLLEDYPKEGLTVDQMIEVSKIPRISFYKQFEKAFGISPGKAIRSSRVRKAKKCLMSSDLSITSVGRFCGFAGESDFTNFFKREVGLPPKTWRLQTLAAVPEGNHQPRIVTAVAPPSNSGGSGGGLFE